EVKMLPEFQIACSEFRVELILALAGPVQALRDELAFRAAEWTAGQIADFHCRVDARVISRVTGIDLHVSGSGFDVFVAGDASDGEVASRQTQDQIGSLRDLVHGAEVSRARRLADLDVGAPVVRRDVGDSGPDPA